MADAAVNGPHGESPRTPEVRRYWADFCARSGVEPDRRWDVFGFGDSAEMAGRLGDLVLHGPKRATAGLRVDFAPYGPEPLPEVGAYSVLLGASEPIAVLRTTDLQVKPMNEVDEAFAWDEGEGDRSLRYWMDAHRSFFTRRLAARGEAFTDDMPVVLERFELVWPQPDAQG